MSLRASRERRTLYNLYKFNCLRKLCDGMGALRHHYSARLRKRPCFNFSRQKLPEEPSQNFPWVVLAPCRNHGAQPAVISAQTRSTFNPPNEIGEAGVKMKYATARRPEERDAHFRPE